MYMHRYYNNVGNGLMPPKKPEHLRKVPITVTIDPEHRKWLKDNYSKLGFRSESHAVDEAIRELIKSKSDR